MKLQITIPEETADRARAMAEFEHRDVRRQIEKIIIDAMREAAAEDSQRKLVESVGAPRGSP
jgi:hypothetical protein